MTRWWGLIRLARATVSSVAIAAAKPTRVRSTGFGGTRNPARVRDRSWQVERAPWCEPWHRQSGPMGVSRRSGGRARGPGWPARSRSLWARPGTSSSTPLNSRALSTRTVMSVSAVTRGGAGAVVEQRQLADGVAGAEGADLAAVALHRGRALDDHEGLAPGVALVDQHGAGVAGDLVGRLGDPLEVPLAQRREQRDLGEVLQVLAAGCHGARSVRTTRSGRCLGRRPPTVRCGRVGGACAGGRGRPRSALRRRRWPGWRRLGGGRDGCGVAEGPVEDGLGLGGPGVVVELVDERDAGGDVEAGDVVVGDAVEVLHQRPQAVAVGGHQHGAAAGQVGDDRVEPVRQHAGDHVGQALRRGQHVGGDLGVAGVGVGVERVARPTVGGGGMS